MPAVFKVSSTFSIESRKLFVVPGEITSGVVRAGMLMRPTTSACARFPISSLEFVDYVGDKRGEIALCTRYRNEEHLAFLNSLFSEGAVLAIEDADANERHG